MARRNPAPMTTNPMPNAEVERCAVPNATSPPPMSTATAPVAAILPGGRAAGEVFKTLFVLANTEPLLASWKHAIQIVEETAKRNKVKGGRSKLLQAKDRFLSVAHLWAAWSIRGGKIIQKPEVGYGASADFQMFLAEAEFLRRWGQTWRQPRATSESPLTGHVWRVPHGWEPPAPQPGWPKTGMIPVLTLSKEFTAELKPTGRPRKKCG